MPFITLEPIISKEKALQARERVLILMESLSFFKDPKGGKYSYETHEQDGIKNIFSHDVFIEIGDKILSGPFLEHILYLLNAQGILNERGFTGVKRLKPYVAPFARAEYGDHAVWKGSLKHLNGSRKRLQKLYQDHLYLGYLPIIPRMQLSVMRPGSNIAPHTDVPNKLVSIMIYLPKDDMQLGCRLGTSFWYEDPALPLGGQLDSIHNLNWKDDKRFQAARVENTFYGFGSTVVFFRTDTSWHSVEIPLEEAHARVSININLNLPADLSI